MAIVEVKDLVKPYDGRAVVDGVSFSVEEGEIFAILGPNGAGKTTTVEIIEGLRAPDGGTVSVTGLDPQRDGGRLRSAPRRAARPCCRRRSRRRWWVVSGSRPRSR